MSLIKGQITASNIGKICKICLEEKTYSLPLVSTMEFKDIQSSTVTLNEILSKIKPSTEIAVLDSEQCPKLICHNCMSELRTVYLFMLKYEQALKLLNQFLTSDIKQEEDDCLEDSTNQAEDNDDDDDDEPVVKMHYATRNNTKKQQNRASNQTKKRARKKKPATDSDADDDIDFATNRKKGPTLHACPICTKEFPALELRDHAHTHKALKKYLNIPSDKKVTPVTKFYTVRHINSTNVSLFNQIDKRHKCPYCNLEFPVQEFRQHIDVHRKQTEFKCDKCERVFRRLNHLNTHRVKHLKEFPYKCEQCGKGFVIKTNYDCHILTHTNDELPHECRYCFKRFSNPEHLNRHMIIHTENVTYSVKYKVCKCHHCLKTFKDKGELKCHTCVPVEHAANTRYPCKTCKKVFKHSSGLYNHNRNIHKLKGAKTLCSVCGNYVSNIYNHMMRHTGEKPYQCNQCEKRFIAKPQLRQHLLVHSGLKPYVCSVCAKAFNNLYNLQVHERIHKGDRCHICPICSKGFLEKSYLKKHMNVHAKA